MNKTDYKIWILTGILIFAGLGIVCSGKGRNPPSGTAMAAEKAETTGATLISIYDNYQADPALKTAWGFGCVVKTPEELILFDTGGDPEILLFNMGKLGIDPKTIRKVIISHIHADHLGGLDGFLGKSSDVTVFIPASLPDEYRQMIMSHGSKYVDVAGFAKISDCTYTTGELPGPPNEQSLIINSTDGLIIITGCAHPGVVNIVKKAKELMKADSVYLVLGGFHHPELAVVKELRRLGVKKVAPSHCTGDPARNGFAQEYGEDFIAWGVGKELLIDDQTKKPEVKEK